MISKFIKTASLASTLTLMTALVGCLTPSAPTPVGTRDSTGSTSGTSSGGSTTSIVGSSDPITTYQNAGGVKVILNKANFYSNGAPNALGCAGDAKYYFDPKTDRRVPTGPTWLKNIAVDITNSNALYGASQASGCSFTGMGAAPAANCASFDDLQPLDGSASRTVMIGGLGCKTSPGGPNCSPTTILPDIWNLTTSDVTTASTWILQNGQIPPLSGTASSPGLSWHSGDYDQLHDKFYIYGGVTNSVTSGSYDFSTGYLVRVDFGDDRSVSTTVPPKNIDSSTTPNFYAGWAKAGAYDGSFPAGGFPGKLLGHNFTYGLRRDPSFKSWCRNTDAFTGWACRIGSSLVTDTKTAVAANEHEDFYLLTGGVDPLGMFSSKMWMYKPHGLTNDIGTGIHLANDEGDWNLLSNVTSANTSNKVMSIADIGYSSSTTVPYRPTFVGGIRPSGLASDIFSGWVGHAYQRTVYDPTMNRFYIFGGLINKNALTSGALSASSNIPELAPTEVWFYDPPALGRRPTSTCYTNATPDNVALPSANVLGTNTNFGPNRAYTASPFVFPPGGCLQRVVPPQTSIPAARFEHAMAFDRDHKEMVVFGGCNAPAVIKGMSAPLPSSQSDLGNPLSACNSSSTLLSDTWIYFPPTVTEIVPNTYRSDSEATLAQSLPYKAASLLPNIFGTDFWLDHLPLFQGSSNLPSNGSLTAPTPDQVFGTWIKMSPITGGPPPRASASMVYDRAHGKFYMQGGFGCIDANCAVQSAHALSDLWEYTPPNPSSCDMITATCNDSGTWKLLKPDNKDSSAPQASQRFGSVMAYAEGMSSFGDDFYTVNDLPCTDQGPIASTDSSVNKQYVGAIYVDVDRNQMDTNQNLLINLRLLPFDQTTKLPGIFDNNTPLLSVDDTDQGSSTDQAVIRVRVLTNPMRDVTSVQGSPQPRYHEFVAGTPVIADELVYIGGASGQVTEKQILIPLSIDPSANLIKIERVSGTVKFYEMTVNKF